MRVGRNIPKFLPGCLAAVLLVLVSAAMALQGDIREYEVKAAFLLNFTKFIQWPPEAAERDAPFAICVLEEDPFGPILDQLVNGESVGGRRLVVQRISRQSTGGCRMLFVPEHDRDFAKLLSGIGPGVLTVGEGAQFLRGGGMVAFVVDNRRVRFDINLTAAQRAGLKISSKLLSVARSVER